MSHLVEHSYGACEAERQRSVKPDYVQDSSLNSVPVINLISPNLGRVISETHHRYTRIRHRDPFNSVLVQVAMNVCIQVRLLELHAQIGNVGVIHRGWGRRRSRSILLEPFWQLAIRVLNSLLADPSPRVISGFRLPLITKGGNASWS